MKIGFGVIDWILFSFSPVWNEQFVLNCSFDPRQTHCLKFSVWSWNKISKDSLMQVFSKKDPVFKTFLFFFKILEEILK